MQPNKYTYYAGNYVYTGDNSGSSLKFFNHAEGYVEPDGSGGYDYIYQYKDHLGNVRLSYMDSNNNGSVDSSEILEENNYYPFGMRHKGYNSVVNSTNPALKFKYNGVEYEEALGLDLYEMDVRMCDPAIARFNGLDPVTHFSQGTSVAFDNNPIFWADPSGADAMETMIYYADGGSVVNQIWNEGMYTSLRDRGAFTAGYAQAQSDALFEKWNRRATVSTGELQDGIKYSYIGDAPNKIDFINDKGDKVINGLILWAVYINSGNPSSLNEIFEAKVENKKSFARKTADSYILGPSSVKSKVYKNKFGESVSVGFEFEYWLENAFSDHKIIYASLLNHKTHQDQINFVGTPIKDQRTGHSNQPLILWIRKGRGRLIENIRNNLRREINEKIYGITPWRKKIDLGF